MPWVERPERQPMRCFWSFQSKPEDGPYYEHRLDYFDVERDPKTGKIGMRPAIQRLYQSPQAIREMCERPGSPLVALTREEHEAQVMEIERRDEELADLSARLEEARAEIATLRAAPPVDVEALSQNLIVSLDGRYARKPGPKPRQAA